MQPALALTVGLAALLTFASAALAIEPFAAPIDPDTIAESEYVVVKDGQLYSQGRRQRFWAAIGKLHTTTQGRPTDDAATRARNIRVARAGTDQLVARFEYLGFNAARMWDGFSQDDSTYTPGDGSPQDDTDYFVARAKAAGFRIWVAGLNAVGNAVPADVTIVDDPATAAAWRAALEEAGGRVSLRNNPARIWDARLEAIAIRRMVNVATHYNHWTGLRWCDDPVFAVWELSNEEWWIRRMLTGSWQSQPAFFRNQLVAKWNVFLKGRYGDDAALAAAWGALLPGESLERGTVLLAPMDKPSKAGVSINDASQHAADALKAMDQEYGREDFAPRRGSDVLAFLTDLVIAHKQRESAAIKPLGRSTRLSPMIYDTGIGYRIQSQYMHQFADAVSHDAYVNGVGWDQWDRVEQAEGELAKMQQTLSAELVAATTGRWNNWLLKPPAISQGVPWLEHNKAPGMPFLCYETQIQQPAKYRADFPLRLLALAAAQDWDWICWHYFGDGSLDAVATTDKPFEKPMDITTGGHPQGYHYTYDEVQSAMMRAAGYAFRHGAFEPAPQPTVFLYGRNSLYDPASMPYGGSYGKLGMDMLQTTYEHGMRLWIDPSRETDAVVGQRVPFAQRNTHNPYRPTGQITFDHKKGWLLMDSPAAAQFTGLLANYGEAVAFERAPVTLRDVTIHNPDGIYEPVTDAEKYIAFSLYSTDGRPLAECTRASLSIVSTSFNSGFVLAGDRGATQTKRGELPVLVARVGATVDCPALDGMRYTMYDWNGKAIGTGKVAGGRLTVPADQPVFVIELER